MSSGLSAEASRPRVDSAPKRGSADTWPGSLQTGLLAGALMWLAESLYLPFSYVAGLLSSGREWAELYARGFSVAVLFGFVLMLVHRGWLWVSRISERTSPAQIRAFARGQAALLVVVGILLVNNGGGRAFRLAPWWQSLAAALPGVFVWLVLRRRARAYFAPYARGALLWSCLTVLHWMGYVSMYLKGGFGLDTPSGRTRTVVMLGLPCVTAAVVGLYFARPGGRPSRTLCGLVGLGLLSVCYFADAYFYVDNSLDLHRALGLFTALGAWSLAALFPALKVRGTSALAVTLAVTLSAAGLSAIYLGAAPENSVIRYVGGVHTTFQRLGLQGHTRLSAGPRAVLSPFRRILAIAGVRGSSSSREEGDELPETFRMNALTEVASRPALASAVLFLLDMKRPRDFGIYGLGSQTSTPRIDACFSDAFVFDRAYSAGNNTSVAYPTVYSGTFAATRHQNHPLLVAPSFWTKTADGQNLGESFKRAGFKTIALVDHWYYEQFFLPPKQQAIFSGFSALHGAPNGVSPATLERAYAALRPLFSEQGRFFGVFHVEAHEPARLREVDAFIGKVCADLRELGLFERTALLLTADHGVQYREHGRTTYGHTLFDEEIRVPLLVRVPSLRGRRVSDRVSSVDHLATLLDLFHIPQDFPTEGESYLPVLFGKPLDPERVVFSETRKPVYSIAAMQKNLKLIHWPQVDAFALFDLAEDPAERTSRAADAAYGAAFTFLRHEIERFRTTHGELFWNY